LLCLFFLGHAQMAATLMRSLLQQSDVEILPSEHLALIMGCVVNKRCDLLPLVQQLVKQSQAANRALAVQ
jgi:hypothetical protein